MTTGMTPPFLGENTVHLSQENTSLRQDICPYTASRCVPMPGVEFTDRSFSTPAEMMVDVYPTKNVGICETCRDLNSEILKWCGIPSWVWAYDVPFW